MTENEGKVLFVWISAAARSVLHSFRFDNLNPPWTYCLQHSWQLMWHWGQDSWMSHQHEVGVTQQTLTPQDSVSCIHPICFLYHTHTHTYSGMCYIVQWNVSLWVQQGVCYDVMYLAERMKTQLWRSQKTVTGSNCICVADRVHFWVTVPQHNNS